MSAADRLKSLADRILKLMDERDAIGSDIKDVFTEVKSAGFNAPALRKVIAAMRMDTAKREALEFDINAYRLAVGLERAQAEEMLADGAGIRETHRATGAPLATLHRRSASRAKTENGTDRASNARRAPEGGGEGVSSSPDPITPSAAAASSPKDESSGRDVLAEAPHSPGTTLAPPDGLATAAADTPLPTGAFPQSVTDCDPVAAAPPAVPVGDLATPAFLKRGTPENDRARGIA